MIIRFSFVFNYVLFYLGKKVKGKKVNLTLSLNAQLAVIIQLIFIALVILHLEQKIFCLNILFSNKVIYDSYFEYKTFATIERVKVQRNFKMQIRKNVNSTLLLL